MSSSKNAVRAANNNAGKYTGTTTTWRNQTRCEDNLLYDSPKSMSALSASGQCSGGTAAGQYYLTQPGAIDVASSAHDPSRRPSALQTFAARQTQPVT
jgi:hypothetical protein